MFEFDSNEQIENQREREREDKSGVEAVIDRQRKEFFFLVKKLIFLLLSSYKNIFLLFNQLSN